HMVADQLAQNLPIIGASLEVTAIDAEHRSCVSWNPGNRISAVAVIDSRASGRSPWQKTPDRAASHEHRACFGVIGADGGVLDGGPTELGQCDHNDMVQIRSA